MSQNKQPFQLKQHTPIIHFQYEQNGATLRATELKPKFDDYLEKMDSSLPFKEHHNNQKSLDYKVKIISKGNKTIEFEKYPPLYFGNQRGSKPKQKVIGSDVTIEFFSFSKQILEAIEEHFEAFLANTNFGTRQSKGYGCFYIKDKPFDASLIDKTEFTKVYAFDSTKNSYEKDIKDFYRLMRSGINEIGTNKTNVFYAKSLLFMYFEKKGIIWDKKAVKMHFINKEESTTNQYIIRDLLGLSSFQNWKHYGFNVSKSNRNISRFKSPIIFKPIFKGDKVKVYFWAKKFDSKHLMLNQPFRISGRGSFTIKTPARFDIEDFLEFVYKIDLKDVVDKKFLSASRFFIPLQNLFKSRKVVS